jgi:hypothetical protein
MIRNKLKAGRQRPPSDQTRRYGTKKRARDAIEDQRINLASDKSPSVIMAR